MYIVRMNGEKIRPFSSFFEAKIWADKYCKGKIEIAKLVDCGRLPAASKMRHPMESIPKGFATAIIQLKA